MKKKLLLSICLTFSTLEANNFKSLLHSASYGNVHSQYNLATHYKQNSYSQNDLQKAFRWYHKSAKKGYVASQYQLGLMFHYGQGVKQNSELAQLWFRRASKQGHPQAQSIMYRFYNAKNPPKQLFYATKAMRSRIQ